MKNVVCSVCHIWQRNLMWQSTIKDNFFFLDGYLYVVLVATGCKSNASILVKMATFVLYFLHSHKIAHIFAYLKDALERRIFLNQ